MARRPVGVVLDDPDLIAICDDGTVWNYLRGPNEWHRLASIPGSPATKKEAAKAQKKDRKKERRQEEEAPAEIL